MNWRHYCDTLVLCIAANLAFFALVCGQGSAISAPPYQIFRQPEAKVEVYDRAIIVKASFRCPPCEALAKDAKELIEDGYDIRFVTSRYQGKRYTSYPTVVFVNLSQNEKGEWVETIKDTHKGRMPKEKLSKNLKPPKKEVDKQ